MSQEKLEQEIDQLREQLKTLRLPHKLNQYRSFEKRLLSLRKLSENVPDKSYQLDQLQSQLDNSVLCGVSQCFLCASNQNALPNKVPLYNRSVSAGMVPRSRYSNENRVSAQIPKFGKQISYHHQLTKKDEPLLKEAPPTPPASIHSEDSSDQCESNASTVHIEPIINDKSETGSGYAETNSPVCTSDNNPKDSNKSQNYLDHVETNTPVFTSTSDIIPKENDKSEHILEDKQTAEVNQNGEQSHSNAKDTSTVLASNADSNAEEPRTSLSYINNKIMTKSNMVAGPLPFRTTSSYRTYKDFVNNYSVTDRNKKSQVPDKRAA